MNPLWLLRMRRWVSRPPSMARVLLVLAVIGLCLGLLAIETWIGWPEWMKVERTPRLPRF